MSKDFVYEAYTFIVSRKDDTMKLEYNPSRDLKFLDTNYIAIYVFFCYIKRIIKSLLSLERHLRTPYKKDFLLSHATSCEILNWPF